MERGKCPVCGGRLGEVLPHGSYIELETCCVDCGYVYEIKVVLVLSREQIERIAGDLKKIGDDVKILGSNPLKRDDLLNVLKERSVKHFEKILQIIRIKLTSCVECGKLLEYTTKKPKRCPECQRKHRAEYMRKYRAKKKV